MKTRLKWLVYSPKTYKVIRIGMAGVFFLAGLSKFVNLDIFLMILEVYIADANLSLPMSVVKPSAVFLACLEIITGIGLAYDKRGFLTLMSSQMFIFIALLLYGILTGLDTPCGCFVLDDPDNPFHNGLAPALYRDLVMVLAIIYLYWWRAFVGGASKGHWR